MALDQRRQQIRDHLETFYGVLALDADRRNRANNDLLRLWTPIIPGPAPRNSCADFP